MSSRLTLLNSQVISPSRQSLGLIPSPLNFLDLVAAGGGHDFLLQASNALCAETAFESLRMPWIIGQMDATSIATLRASGAVFQSAVLNRVINAQVGTLSSTEIILLFSPHDIQFDSMDQCRLRLNVQVGFGSSFRMPDEPELSHRVVPGEAVQQRNLPRFNEPRPLSPAIFANDNPTVQTPVMRTLSDPLGVSIERNEVNFDRRITIRELGTEIDLGGRSTFKVSAWLGNALLEVPAVITLQSDATSKTIRVAAGLHQSSVEFTNASGDAALLLAKSDPLGLAQSITFRLRQQGSAKLVSEVSLLGAPPSANAGHLGPMQADAFPTRTGASSFNISANVVPGRIGARKVTEFIGAHSYGVLWSADAVRLLVRYCWETGAFPRGVVQSQSLRVNINGVEHNGEAFSIFQLEELTNIELEVDSNGDRDVLYTNGSARVVPKFIRLEDGREVIPQDPNDPIFKPSKRMRWSAFGELTQDAVSASTPELLTWMKAVTNGVTCRLGRPFSEQPLNAVVAHSRISVPQQRVALLIK